MLKGILICYKRGLPGAARDYFKISLWNSPVQIDLRTLRALGWGEHTTNKNVMYKPTPRSNFCLLAPAQFSKHTPLFGRVDPVGPRNGWAPHKWNFTWQTHPRSNFCFLAPTQFFTLQGFSDGVTIGGTPRGQHFGSSPGSVLSQGEMRSPCQISGC
jgi:hypothetical protein